jgi:hypothetical protein
MNRGDKEVREFKRRERELDEKERYMKKWGRGKAYAKGEN